MAEQRDLVGLPNPEDLVQQDLMDPSSDKWPSMLTDMVGVLEAQLIRDGLPRERAGEVAAGLALALGEYLGGRQVYIPRGDRLRTALRHAKAWRMWKGDNIEDIMRLLGVSQTSAYRVLQEQRELHRERIQGGLFNNTEKGR
jgi:Mor family transcriptional regulator